MSKQKIKKDKIIVGLDIGTTKICAIVGRMNENGKIDVLGMGKAPSMGGVSRGMVSNITKTVEAIRRAVAEASRQSNIEINRVYVGIAGHHISSRQQNFAKIRSGNNEITQLDLDDMEAQMHKVYIGHETAIMHIMPQEYTIDGETGIKDPIGMHGMKLECSYHIITGQTTAAKNITQAVQKAGLEVEDLIVEPIASARAVLSDDEMMAGVALVDIGGGTSDIAIFHDGIIRHTAVVPLGGDIITTDIQEAFGLLKEQAEALKTRFGSAISEGIRHNQIVTVSGLPGRKAKEISLFNLAQVIQARVQEIFDLVYDQIRLSGYKNRLSAGIVLTGGGANLANIAELIEFITTLEVHQGLPNKHLAKGMVDEVRSPMFSTAVGLVLKGFDKEMRGQGSDLPDNKPAEKEGRSRFGFSGLFGSLINGIIKDDTKDFND
jgi:cell division protein FtsA